MEYSNKQLACFFLFILNVGFLFLLDRILKEYEDFFEYLWFLNSFRFCFLISLVIFLVIALLTNKSTAIGYICAGLLVFLVTAAFLEGYVIIVYLLFYFNSVIGASCGIGLAWLYRRKTKNADQNDKPKEI
ncbi:hypothetical protein [Alteribacter aurantiacus]|uniref:hypothetical protein n=1 Tax=Alteribacter aurantiacus TaxID=254410 RepID=UPI000479AA57|nr:hypothetical protein [Alteribacter aurantiacus]